MSFKKYFNIIIIMGGSFSLLYLAYVVKPLPVFSQTSGDYTEIHDVTEVTVPLWMTYNRPVSQYAGARGSFGVLTASLPKKIP